MTLDEKIEKSDQDLKKAKQRLEKIQQENQRLKELKAKKEKEEREKRQKELGAFIERQLGTVDLKDPKFLEFLDCVKEDFGKKEPLSESVSEPENSENQNLEHGEFSGTDQKMEETEGFRF